MDFDEILDKQEHSKSCHHFKILTLFLLFPKINTQTLLP